jgi:hypothetical protein
MLVHIQCCGLQPWVASHCQGGTGMQLLMPSAVNSSDAPLVVVLAGYQQHALAVHLRLAHLMPRALRRRKVAGLHTLRARTNDVNAGTGRHSMHVQQTRCTRAHTGGHQWGRQLTGWMHGVNHTIAVDACMWAVEIDLYLWQLQGHYIVALRNLRQQCTAVSLMSAALHRTARGWR